MVMEITKTILLSIHIRIRQIYMCIQLINGKLRIGFAHILCVYNEKYIAHKRNVDFVHLNVNAFVSLGLKIRFLLLIL